MKNAIQLISLGILFLFGCQQEEKGILFEDAFCIEDISIIDPEKGLIEHQTVIIKGDKIHKVVASSELILSANNEIIDGKGKFILPGLWDAHVHFAFLEDLAPSMFDLFLSSGITSVRDTGGKIDFVKKWQEKALTDPTNAPRVMIAGPLLDGMPNVYDGSDSGHPPLSVGLNSVEAVTRYINKLDSIGVDLLKAYEMLTPEQFAQVTLMAREKGFKVTGHVPLSMDVVGASNAGMNSMEHLRNLELSCASNADELLEQRQQLLAAGRGETGGILRSRIHQAQRQTAITNYDDRKTDDVLQVLAKNDTWQIPTLVLNVAFAERPFSAPEWQEKFKYLPDYMEQEWLTNIAAIEEYKPSPFSLQYAKWKYFMVGKIHQAEIEIMAGTDCPISFLVPGQSLHLELEILVEAGLSPLDAIKTATINPAKYFNLEEELGAVKENRWADLVILNANPLEDITNTQRIDAVIKQGKHYDRAALDQLLDRLDASK